MRPEGSVLGVQEVEQRLELLPRVRKRKVILYQKLVIPELEAPGIDGPEE